MKIGIIGTGNIGKTLALKLSGAGHDVKVANSRGPETIDKSVLANGARAVTSADAVQDVDVVITSTPPWAFPKLAPLFKPLPENLVVIDTSNYYPGRDERIEAIENGQVESVWTAEQIGRPIVKAWNAIYTESFATKGTPRGTPGRIAIPIAADRDADYDVAAKLMDDTGFDAVKTGKLEDSWRQQPGTPVYCTDLTAEEAKKALQAADRAEAPKRRDESLKIVMQLVQEKGRMPTSDEVIPLNRKLYRQ